MKASSRKIPLSIISGFLGAGKTTFIRNLVQREYSSEKVVVLENEFGKIDLDSGNLSRERILVESVTGGCICCSSSGMLTQSIQAIITKHHPDRIIIEPTGLALLTDLLESLREPQIKEQCDFSHIITIVDAGNFCKRINISKMFFENQITASRVIFLSKTSGLRQDQISEVTANIQAVNPFCEVIENTWDQIPDNVMKAALAFSSFSDRARNANDRFVCEGMAGNYPLSESSALSERCAPEESEDISADVFQNFTFASNTFVPLRNIQSLFDGFEKNKYGEIYRAKGVFQTEEQKWVTCEYVPGEVRFRSLMQEMPPGETVFRICVIGIRINSGKMRSTLMNTLENLTI